MEHGKCASRTIRALGYSSKAFLKQWVTELCPEENEDGRPLNRDIFMNALDDYMHGEKKEWNEEYY